MNMFRHLYKKHQETTHNFFWRSLQIFARGSVTLFIYFIAAKFLSPEVFGQLNYLTALLALFIIFCDFGMSAAVSKYIAEYKVTDPEKIKETLFSVLVLIIIIAGAISGAILIFGKPLLKNNYKYIIYLLPYLFFLPISSLLDGVFRGLKRFKELSLVSLIVGLLCATSSFFLIKHYLLSGAIISLNLLYALTALCLFLLSRELSLNFSRDTLKTVTRYAALIGLANLAFFLYSKVDILILKQFGYIVEVGYYGIIEKLFLMVFIPATILGQAIAPNITKYASLGELNTVKTKFISCITPIFAAAIPFTIIIWLVFPIFLAKFLPDYFTPDFLLILKLLLFLLPFKIWGSFISNAFITPAGFARITTLWTLIGGLLNVLFDYISIYYFGFIGVFIVTLCIHSIIITIQTLIFYSRLPLKT